MVNGSNGIQAALFNRILKQTVVKAFWAEPLFRHQRTLHDVLAMLTKSA
jgi:hypothetical protein